MATGTLGRAQLEALESILVALSAEQAFRVLLVHHPLHSDSRPKRLTDSRQLLALVKKHGVELILHGHDHVHSTMWFEGPERRFPSIGVPAASALAREDYPAAAYNLSMRSSATATHGAASRSRAASEMTCASSEIGRTRLHLITAAAAATTATVAAASVATASIAAAVATAAAA